MKSAAYYRGKEQTYLKHFFLERYLDRVGFHIGYAQQEFVYVDCFSGPWKAADEDLADTSIRIALDKLNYVRRSLAEQGRNPTIRAIFIERDATAFGTLQTALEQHRHAISTIPLNGTFESNIPAILQHVGRAFSFIFIDPTGWSGFAMDEISSLLRHQPGEVMVNFMWDFINRFINYPDEANERSLDRFFGTTEWRHIRTSADREAASLDLYKEQLRTTGRFTFVTSTRILKPLSDRAYFHLVYATRNPKGIYEFREVEKKTDKEQNAVRETVQREYRETKSGQTELLFGTAGSISQRTDEERNRRLEEARARILAIMLQEQSIQYETLQPRVLELPLVWNTDLNAILLTAQREGHIAIEGMTPRQRIPKKGCLIRLRRE
jgi:three-Cys-motif partner protein